MTTTQWEIFAAYGGLSVSDLGRIMGDRNLNPTTQAELLATALAMPFKETARAHYRSLLEGQGRYSEHVVKGLEWLSHLELLDQSNVNLEILPTHSFFISFTFRLSQPYLSKDDDAFYIIDNPVRKDKVFKTPYVAPSSWKGSLRHALWQQCARHDGKEHCDEQVKRLFGETRDNDTGQSGRLFFYPTFFDRISLEIINPHDRERRVGKNPILFECVPIGATGQFTLLYVPFDRIGNEEADPERGRKSLPKEVAEDLQLLAQGLEALFTRYGFGAKISSGFGLAELTGTGQFAIHYPDVQSATSRPQEPDYPAAVQAFLEHYPPEYLEMKPKQLKDAGVSNRIRQQVKEIKESYRTYQSELAHYQAALAEWEAATATPPSPVTEWTFSTFADLVSLSQALAASLTAGGAA